MGSDSYLVSARKHRPQTFKDLVSQTHVTETLQNAINRNRVGQAYLFSGPRGVGKTTVARLLAKAINCQTELDKRDGAEPCGSCESCSTIGEGRSMNIIEIDAASNNGVDDARDLRDTVRIPPQGALKKVYIIDEVHMMSTQAFNALLKTLEEPPDYVHFIFATTEPKKVLPTILSRCQRFNFRRISVTETYERLRHICEIEGIKADEASLMLIARKGDGALRDALSSFDQAISLCGTDITYDALSAALGLIDDDRYFEVSDLILASDRPALIKLLNQIISDGFDLEEFASGLSNHLRNLYLAKSMNSTDLIDADGETKSRYAELAASFSELDLMRLLMVASETENGLRRAIHPRLSLELGLLKMASLSSTSELSELLEIVKKANSNPSLATRVVSEKPPLAKSQVQASSISPKTESRDEPSKPTSSFSASKVEAKNTMIPGTSAAVKLAIQDPVEQALPEPAEAEVKPTVVETEVTEASDEQANEALTDRAPEEAQAPPEEAPLKVVQTGSQSGPTTSLFGSAALSSAPQMVAQEPESADQDSKPSQPTQNIIVKELSQGLVHLKGIWPKYCKSISADRIQVGALLQHASLENYTEETVWLKVPDNFHLDLLQSESEYLKNALQEVAGEYPVSKLHFICDEKADSSDSLEPDKEIVQQQNLEKLKSDNPIVRTLLDRFDATIVW